MTAARTITLTRPPATELARRIAERLGERSLPRAIEIVMRDWASARGIVDPPAPTTGDQQTS